MTFYLKYLFLSPLRDYLKYHFLEKKWLIQKWSKDIFMGKTASWAIGCCDKAGAKPALACKGLCGLSSEKNNLQMQWDD